MEDKNIHFIVIKPHTQFSVLYYINTEKQSHTKLIKDMEKFLLNLIGKSFYPQINKLLYSFIPFFIDIKNKSIEELKIDKEKELNFLKSKMKQIDPKKQIKRKNISKLDKFNQLGGINLNFSKIMNKK